MANLRGIILMTAAMAGFALEDMVVKLVADDMSVGQILAIVGLGGALAFAIWAKLAGHRLWTEDSVSPPVIWRNLFEMAGTICFVTALTLMPITSLSAILQATPVFVTLGAVLFLGEPVGWRRWSAIFVGFLGVLIIIRPGTETFEPASILGLVAVLCLAGRDVTTRAAPPTLPSVVLALYGFAAAGLSGLLLLLTLHETSPVEPHNWGILAFGLVAGVAGYYAITAAMRVGEVSVISPFRYSRMIFALIIGVTVFGERPDGLTLLGAFILISSGLYMLWREQKARSAALP